MTPRFIAVVDDGLQTENEEPLATLVNRSAREQQLHPVFASERCVVLADSNTPILPLSRSGGVVVGHLFHRDDQAAVVRAGDRVLGEAASQSKGESLLETAWGGYVAVVADRDGDQVHILRDPSGVMPCFQAKLGRRQIFFSDLEPLLALGLVKAAPDPGALAQQLVFRHLRTARTGLKGVGEILAGMRTSVGPGGARSVCCWTPWKYADRAAQITDRKAAVRAVREETERCVAAWASTSRSILLELSGGLDSSIVAACLAGQPASVSCVTLVTPDPGADERRYAAQVAASTGRPLIAVPLRADAVDLTDPPQIALPRAGLGALQVAVDQALACEGRRLDVDSFFGGGGGDNVFCYLSTAAPAVDAFLVSGPSTTMVRALRDLGRVHDCSPCWAGWLALKKRLRGPGTAWPADTLFIDAAAAAVQHEEHAWLQRPPDALPGKIEHIRSLMRIQTAPDGKARPAFAPVRHPLLAQPLVELCLRIPSWMWIRGGQNRSVAREAFADRLPPEIRQRRSKGEFVTFCGSIFERNRQVLRDQLVDGWLDRAGILDHDSLETYFANPAPPRDTDFFRLLDIAGVETWARSWARRRDGA
jgi:asparagine synthase (glutamine-hydrolysing)